MGHRPRALVLGTLPGRKSLEVGEYYANAGNAFWYVMGELFGASPETLYLERCRRVTEARVAIWDVLAFAEREGSSDDAIAIETAVANDFFALLQSQPSIEAVYFNGGRAHALWESLVQHRLSAHRSLDVVGLPSTSSANTHSTRLEKANAWRILGR